MILRKIVERMLSHERSHAKATLQLSQAGSCSKITMISVNPTGKFLMNFIYNHRVAMRHSSPWYANIFVNIGEAALVRYEELIEYAQKVVHNATGFCLEPEVLFVGEF